MTDMDTLHKIKLNNKMEQATAKGKPNKKPTQSLVNDEADEKRMFFENLKSSRVMLSNIHILERWSKDVF
jgi:hypothetical protein